MLFFSCHKLETHGLARHTYSLMRPEGILLPAPVEQVAGNGSIYDDEEFDDEDGEDDDLMDEDEDHHHHHHNHHHHNHYPILQDPTPWRTANDDAANAGDDSNDEDDDGEWETDDGEEDSEDEDDTEHDKMVVASSASSASSSAARPELSAPSIPKKTVGAKAAEGLERFVQLETAPADHHWATQPKVGAGNKYVCFIPTVLTTSDRSRSRRIMQEHAMLSSSLPEGIFVRVYEDNLDVLRAVIIGPAGTPYQDIMFWFDFSLPADFPNAPPL